MDTGSCIGNSAWRLAVCCFSVLVTQPFGAAQSSEPSANLHPLADEAIRKMKPALVRIHVVSTEYSEGREIKRQSVGSGAINSYAVFCLKKKNNLNISTRIPYSLILRRSIGLYHVH